MPQHTRDSETETLNTSTPAGQEEHSHTHTQDKSPHNASSLPSSLLLQPENSDTAETSILEEHTPTIDKAQDSSDTAAPKNNGSDTPDSFRLQESDAPQTAAPTTETVSAAYPRFVTPQDLAQHTESEARGIRIGQFLWASLVIIIGLLLIFCAFIGYIDVVFALICAIAAVGLTLILAALIIGTRKK
ncbi:hypothetical protein [Schaalia sp. lx-100]|uniref:hypothetical protein n=1 Tax=Schaalia sp. lx-100 TaxID=2899081 RepID=UPI001E46D546|nr:hypothetical protein [Schaalia sp. lx-100]MCD4557228.1 hypothetical protein [Schaalia sp. lx-100]